MEPVAGVFQSADAARRAAIDLRAAGFSPDELNVLFPGSSEEHIHSVPTSDTEQPGVGGAIGGVLGAALGMAGGFELCTAASLLIPGVGPVLAFGIAGAALLGAGGAVGGAVLGEAADNDSTAGLPADEVFLYEDALRQGRSVVIVMANGGGEAARARELLTEAGAESIDAARESWWLGVRDAEAEHYRSKGLDFDGDQDIYRAGFEAAQRPGREELSFDRAAPAISREYPDLWQHPAFRRGYDRGREHRESLSRSHV